MLAVVCVCTGNLCRSPQAEQLIRAGLGSSVSSRVVVSSAGTVARDGDLMHPWAAEWSRRMGGDPASHRASYLTQKTVRGADLVLGMAREHRRAAVALEPVLVKRTFTVREFARLASEFTDAALEDEAASAGPNLDSAGRLRVLLALLARSRGFTPAPVDAAADDVVDPMGRDREVFARSAQQVESSVHQVVRVLQVAGGTSPSS
jgi:protein-tyrosine phosphatase